MTNIIRFLASCALGLGLCGSSMAATNVYLNTSNDTLLTASYSANAFTQIGDRITLGGTDRYLTSATVQFYAYPNAGGSFDAIFRLWHATATGVGTQIGGDYVRSGLSIAANDIANVTFALPQVLVPDEIVFTVAVTPQTSGAEFGPNFFYSPTIGASDDRSYIAFRNGSFLIADAGKNEGNLYLAMQAITAPVPEVPAYAMMACGLGLTLWLARRRRVVVQPAN